MSVRVDGQGVERYLKRGFTAKLQKQFYCKVPPSSSSVVRGVLPAEASPSHATITRD